MCGFAGVVHFETDRQVDVDRLHVVRQVPARDRVLARSVRGRAHDEGEERRLGQLLDYSDGIDYNLGTDSFDCGFDG